MGWVERRGVEAYAEAAACGLDIGLARTLSMRWTTPFLRAAKNGSVSASSVKKR